MKKWVLFAAILIHLLFLTSLFIDLLDPLFFDTHQGKNMHMATDFMSVYTTGWMLLNKGLIYTEPAAGELPVPYYNGVARYLPIFNVVFCAPTNLLPPWTAYWIYIILLEVLLILNILLSRRLAGKGSPSAKFYLTLMWLVYTPFFCELYLGQITFLCATLIFWMLCFGGRRPLLEGLIWNIAIAIKAIPILFTPVLLKEKRYKTLFVTFLFIVLTSWWLMAACSDSGVKDVRADQLIPYAGEGVYWVCGRLGLEDSIPRVKVKEDLLMVYSKLFRNVAVTDYAGSPGFLPMLHQLISSVLPEKSAGAARPARETIRANLGDKGFGQRGMTLKSAENSSALSLTKMFAGLILLLMLYTSFFGRADFVWKLLLWLSGFFLVVFTIREHYYVLLLPVFIFLYLRTGSGLVLLIYLFMALPTPFVLYQSVAIDNWLYFASKGVPAFLLFLWVLKENFSEVADSGRRKQSAYAGKR